MFNNFFSHNGGEGIPSKDVSVRVSSVRTMIYGPGSGSFELPENSEVLDAFYSLAIYVVNNFPIPRSHYGYKKKI